MPRGNDGEAALHELADKFGQGVGNAEMLIDATLAANTQELRVAQALPIDHDATAERLKDIGKLKGPDGKEVVSVAVRGSQSSPNRYTVIVYRTEEGRDLVAALDDKDKPIMPGARRSAEDDESGSKSASSGARSSGSTRT
jgi:hypothetical protein